MVKGLGVAFETQQGLSLRLLGTSEERFATDFLFIVRWHV